MSVCVFISSVCLFAIGIDVVKINIPQSAELGIELSGTVLVTLRVCFIKYKVRQGTENGVQQLTTSLTATGTHMPYGITKCFLPPGRGDILALTRTEAGAQLSEPGGMQG